MTTATNIARYLNVQACSNPTIRADGQQVAFLATITGTPQVWQVTSSNGPPRWPDQLTFGAERVQMVRYAPVGSQLIYGRDVGGNERMQLFLLDPDSGEEVALTAGYEDATHGFGDWSADGKSILFTANRRDPGLFDLYVRPLDGEARLIWQNDTPLIPAGMAFAPDGQRVVAGWMRGSFDHALYEIDLQTGASRQLLPSDTLTTFQSLNYAPDSQTLYLCTDQDADFLYLAKLNLQTGDVEKLVAPDWDVEGCALSPDGNTLAYAVNVDGYSELHALDLVSGATQSLNSFNQGVLARTYDIGAQLVFTPDSSAILFAASTSTQATNVQQWTLGNNQVRSITRAGQGGLTAAHFVAPDLVRYPTFDERQIPAFIYRPHTAGPHPVIIDVHGGPESQSRPEFKPLEQFLVNSGYALLIPNVRGSTGYGNTYSHLDDIEKRLDSVADLAAAADWLRTQPGIDPDRIIIYGRSYGGFMVLSAITEYPNLWAVAIESVGISDFVTFLENTSTYRRTHREQEYGTLAQHRTTLKHISPIHKVDEIKVPLLIQHGENDPRVPVDESRQIAAALEKRGIPVELLIFADEGHGITKLPNQIAFGQAIVDFLNRTLPAT